MLDQNRGERIVRKISEFWTQFKQDEDGAALVEYTVLLGILLVAVIATIVGVGGWVNSKWTTLNTTINNK
jgi:pilus assembly protein Flp/PilA